MSGLVAALLAFAALAWWFRWEVIPLEPSPSSISASAYAVDRLTGRIYWLTRESMFEVKPEQ